MPSVTTVTIGGSAVSPPADVVPLRLLPFAKGGVGSFSFEVIGGLPPAGDAADPYVARPVAVTVNGTLRFAGEVVSVSAPAYRDGAGWTRTYQALELAHLADLVPHVDAINGGNQSAYNVSRTNQALDWVGARDGRSVGQILADVLTNPANAQALSGYGVGGYTGLPSAPALPAATVADLAALTWVPPGPCYFGGDKLWSAVVSFCETWARTRAPRIRPDGTLRFVDMTACTPVTLTYGTDPVRPSGVSRDTTECASRVAVYGAQVAEMGLFSVAAGTLSEAPFAHDGLTVAQAKAAWTTNDWREPGYSPGQPTDDSGSCTCPSTTTVQVTSANAAVHWVAGYWDQSATGREGTLFLWDASATSVLGIAQRSVVANTALAAGGTSLLTLDRPLPVTSYSGYAVTGQVGGASAVWTVYQLPAWAAAKVAPQILGSYAYRAAAGLAVTQTSTAMGTIMWGPGPPYSSETIGVAVDPVTGYVHFAYPTFLVADGVPADVRALVPIYTGVNLVHSPQDAGGVAQYAGTYFTVEGKQRTLSVYVPSWVDPGNAPSMQAFADDLLLSVKDTVREGQATLLTLREEFLEMGVALQLDGGGFATGWEGHPLPVVSCELAWGTGPGDATDHVMTIACSNRLAHFSADQFLRPDRTGQTFDFGAEIGPGFWPAPGDGAAAGAEPPAPRWGGDDGPGFEPGGGPGADPGQPDPLDNPDAPPPPGGEGDDRDGDRP